MAKRQPDPITGRTIVSIRNMTREELDGEGWPRNWPQVAIVLDDGTILYASQDHEGNGPGALFGRTSSGKTFDILRRTS